MIRKPAVAGLFYDSNPDKLKRDIEHCFENKLGPGKIPKLGKYEKNRIYGAVVPHAGYAYSGSVAAHAYYEIVQNGFPEIFIILCPNHTGLGTGISVFTEGVWETPLGKVNIDEEFAKKMVINSESIDSDTSAHTNEHSCEVHLPFLQYFSDDFKIIPIVMWMQDMESAYEVADAICKTSKELNKSISIIASTDLTHYEDKDSAQKKDVLILDAIENMDEFALVDAVENNNISMCGYGPTTATIKASRDLGSKKGKILKYATSGDVSGDLSSVVGYCSAIFE
ncbi:MAG: AmmeMemoRadiSam system protein B [Methanobrevibacter sp.]|nr:AmmeMemoRadiSam system protein B [Methanobrevibacter sp.]